MQSRHYRTVDLANSRVLITGATSGIGRALAFRFAELNCKLYLIGRRDEKLQKLGQDLMEDARQAMQDRMAPPPSHQPELIKFDVTDVHRVPEIAKAIGPVDILVNNAGCKIGGETADAVKTEDMICMVTTNMLAPMALVAAFGPMMKEQGNGHIINIASTASHDVYAKASVYCATKSAINAYSISARHDLIDTPIRVTSISPGLVHSDLHIKAAMGDEAKVAKTFENIIPLSPEDIADQVIYVCTRPKSVQIADVASYCTNQSHSCPGGIAGVARKGQNMGGPAEQISPYSNHNLPQNQQMMTHGSYHPPVGMHDNHNFPPNQPMMNNGSYQQPGGMNGFGNSSSYQQPGGMNGFGSNNSYQPSGSASPRSGGGEWQSAFKPIYGSPQHSRPSSPRSPGDRLERVNLNVGGWSTPQ